MGSSVATPSAGKLPNRSATSQGGVFNSMNSSAHEDDIASLSSCSTVEAEEAIQRALRIAVTRRAHQAPHRSKTEAASKRIQSVNSTKTMSCTVIQVAAAIGTSVPHSTNKKSSVATAAATTEKHEGHGTVVRALSSASNKEDTMSVDTEVKTKYNPRHLRHWLDETHSATHGTEEAITLV